jgi:hypothetical protein
MKLQLIKINSIIAETELNSVSAETKTRSNICNNYPPKLKFTDCLEIIMHQNTCISTITENKEKNTLMRQTLCIIDEHIRGFRSETNNFTKCIVSSTIV